MDNLSNGVLRESVCTLYKFSLSLYTHVCICKTIWSENTLVRLLSAFAIIL